MGIMGICREGRIIDNNNLLNITHLRSFVFRLRIIVYYSHLT